MVSSAKKAKVNSIRNIFQKFPGGQSDFNFKHILPPKVGRSARQVENVQETPLTDPRESIAVRSRQFYSDTL